MRNRPDLYSTIWIYNTIIFLIGIANYFLKILESDNIKEVEFKYEILSVAFNLVSVSLLTLAPTIAPPTLALLLNNDN